MIGRIQSCLPVLEQYAFFKFFGLVCRPVGFCWKDERIGKAANREYELKFLENVQEFHGAKVGRVIIDGDHAAVEWSFDITFKGGNRVKMEQVAVQTWKDGKIIREDFYHG